MVSFEHRVRYHEVDQQGILFNGRYFEIADVGHTEFMRDIGWTYAQLNDAGADPSVVRLEADFSAPARFDDILDVEVVCLRVGRSSFVLQTRISREADGLAVITATHVNVDANAELSRPLPEELADALRAAIVTADSKDDR